MSTGKTVKMEAADPYETLVNIYHITLRRIPEDSNSHHRVRTSDLINRDSNSTNLHFTKKGGINLHTFKCSADHCKQT
jgi:hypothetical protein